VKRHLLLAVLLLFSITLLGTNYIYATTPNQQTSDIIANTNIVGENTVDVQQDVKSTANIQQTTVGTLNDVQAVSNTVTSQSAATNTVKTVNSSVTPNKSSKNSVKIQSGSEAAGDVNNNKAAGSQTTVKSTSVTYTLSEIKDAASRVKVFIESKKKLPNYVQMGTRQITMSQFLQLLTAGLMQVNSGSTGSIALKSVGNPLKPTQNLKIGNIKKSEYLGMAGRINSFINSNGKIPNYASSSLGKIQYESLIYMYSRIINYQSVNKDLPNYATMQPWQKSADTPVTPVTPIPAELQIYLLPTNHCQSTDSRIVALASSITQGSSSAKDRATKLFNWVRDNIDYSFYYNTKADGAVSTLSAGTANCVDTSHLLVALSRASGIPARYVHGICKFSSGTWYGHVWAQLYVDGTWYNADAISYRNYLGVINNWDTSSYTLRGIYAALPF
jgi:Transglutaminase-like superfamily/Pseudomurein-binding repeat